MKFDKSIAQKSLSRSLTGVLGDGKKSTPQSTLYRQFFKTETGDPVDFEIITKRIKRRFSEMNKLSVYAMLDLYFVHKNWKTFYDRTDSFQNYCKDTLQISKAHAYGILHAVDLLEEYFSSDGSSIDAKQFITEIAGSIEQIGIRKLREIAGINEKPVKIELLTKLLDGEEISTDTIVQSKHKVNHPKPTVNIMSTDNVVYKDSEKILTMHVEDEKLQTKLISLLKRFYS